MGYEIPKRTALLTFEGTDYDGAEVRVRLDVGLGFWLKIRELGDSPNAPELYSLFAQTILMDWNLEDEGERLPATEEGILTIPSALANIIINSWMEAVAKPPAPLAKPFGNGSMSGEPLTAKAGR
uniref:Uncharacterized protein n=1 Tax=viral metagenome TaxID=1070528 RepID=A0A6M3XKI8_9ZZZZ